MNWEAKTIKDRDYKKYVGNPHNYELIGKVVFDILLDLGLNRNDKLLDIGCGSLRVGRHLIGYLKANNYYGIEPNDWLINEVIKYVNKDKAPAFNNNSDFDLKVFNESYDFIIANSVFIHACEVQIDKALSQINDILLPGGTFVFNYIEGPNNESKTWTYPSHVTYTKDKITGILDKYKLNYEFKEYKYPGLQKWVIVRG